MTTKICPKCKNENLVKLISQNVKICSDCGKTIPWGLDPGQKPLFSK